MSRIERGLQKTIETYLFKGKTILILGARRVGKTILGKQLVSLHDGIYYNCDLLEVRELLASTNSNVLGNIINNKKLVVLDEAQGVDDIGMKLKILHDTFPEVQFIATGSSSFDLIHKASEPLTGRSRVFKMFPLSTKELAENFGIATAHGKLEEILRFGSYPDVYLGTEKEKIEELENIASNYLYKDMLALGDLKKPYLILEILRLLAFQIGKEVSLNKISNATNTSIHTVRSYLEMLEKSHVLLSLPAFSKNLSKEISKSYKYYFYDTGIRNAIIRNHNPLALRNDVGMLWENFCVLERMKRNESEREFKNLYFWRTYDQQEIDFIEEYEGRLLGFEFKYNSDKFKKPKIFIDTYENSDVSLINKSNYLEFIM